MANDEAPKRRPRPSTTSEGRENQMIALAVDLAEKQLSKGTASSQVIAHYLKLGSSKERVEKEILIQKKRLMEAQIDAIRSAKTVEDLYANALNAMRSYSGNGGGED